MKYRMLCLVDPLSNKAKFLNVLGKEGISSPCHLSDRTEKPKWEQLKKLKYSHLKENETRKVPGAGSSGLDLAWRKPIPFRKRPQNLTDKP